MAFENAIQPHESPRLARTPPISGNSSNCCALSLLGVTVYGTLSMITRTHPLRERLDIAPICIGPSNVVESPEIGLPFSLTNSDGVSASFPFSVFICVFIYCRDVLSRFGETKARGPHRQHQRSIICHKSSAAPQGTYRGMKKPRPVKPGLRLKWWINPRCKDTFPPRSDPAGRTKGAKSNP